MTIYKLIHADCDLIQIENSKDDFGIFLRAQKMYKKYTNKYIFLIQHRLQRKTTPKSQKHNSQLRNELYTKTHHDYRRNKFKTLTLLLIKAKKAEDTSIMNIWEAFILKW